jgi:hypothetical protein
VVRIYDNRFRQTERSPNVYLNCGDIVGESSTILTLLREDESSIDTIDKFNMSDINEPKDPILTIISTPYRKGGHEVSKPSDFVPIIEQLHKLHKKNYVHGDIRAFNTVIGGEGNSWLIDFDFGGKVGDTTKYPMGYNEVLKDGYRCGKGGDPILKSHDWYALGQLIFGSSHYNFKKPDKISQEAKSMFLDKQDSLRNKWTDSCLVQSHITDGDVNDLTEFLIDADKLGYKMKPSQTLQTAVQQQQQQCTTKGTFQGATGSPPKKNT